VTPGFYVQLAVTDTGTGMDKQTQAKIFEPFFTTKEKGKGTGLGLSTVHGIVKQSGGHILVYSETGHGTTFKIFLPREMEASAIVAKPASAPKQDKGTETILVVEDEEALRKVAKRSLGEAGYKVLTAVDGDDALKTYAKNIDDIQLLLTDVVMPRMSGFELVQEVLKMSPNLKVLYMSGYTDNVFFHHGMLDGGVHFIGKPFTADILTMKVREVLDGSIAELAGVHERLVKDEIEKKARRLDVVELRALEPDVLNRLNKAVAAVHYDDIVGIVDSLKPTRPELAAGLRHMVDLFDYEGLRKLLSS
jgi:DNA-binding response OmpR family regulator